MINPADKALGMLAALVFFFKQKTAYEILSDLVGSEMCIRYSNNSQGRQDQVNGLDTVHVQAAGGLVGR